MCREASPRSDAETHHEIRVVTWNVLAPALADPHWYPGVDRDSLGWGVRLPRIVEFLTQKCIADVVLLTEVQQLTHSTLVADETLLSVYEVMPFVPHDLHDGDKWGGNTILVRKSVFVSFEQMPFRVAGDDNHGVLARAVLPDGHHVLVCVTHLDTGATAEEDRECARFRGEQVACILAAIEEALEGDEVVVWGGDFNCPSNGAELAAIFDAGFSLSSRNEGMTEFTCATFGTAAEGWRSPIDHVFVRHAQSYVGVIAQPLDDPHLNPEIAFEHGLAEHPDEIDKDVLCACLQWALKTYGSDHLPVGCSVRLLRASGEGA